jgi:hypothetical protein
MEHNVLGVVYIVLIRGHNWKKLINYTLKVEITFIW